MGHKHITPEQRTTFHAALRNGDTTQTAAAKAGVGLTWAKKERKKVFAQVPEPAHDPQPLISPSDKSSQLLSTPVGYLPEDLDNPAAYLTRPLLPSEMAAVDRDCLDDFARFRYRFFGRLSSPWQEHAADVCRRELSTPTKSYGVINVAPGGGKSTLFTHDIPAWLTCRSRSIRGFIGSSTQTAANGYTGRLRNTFERNVPFEAGSEARALGLGVDAQSTLIRAYGLFRPQDEQPKPPWAKNQFTVKQLGETLVGEKEATWTAFGEDTGFLGWRVNFIVWDDLVTQESFANAKAIEAQRKWWDDEAETRLEPGGLLILQGQRLNSEDLYRYCREKKSGYENLHPDDLIELGIDPGDREKKKYFLIKYKAHHTEICKGNHADNPDHRLRAKPYNPFNPESGGCLLDPFRIPYYEQVARAKAPLSNYEVVYQQEDSAPDSVLIKQLWLDGGTDPDTGINYPGCFDINRRAWEIPRLGGGMQFSVVTVDPSPSNFWSIQWWVYHEPKGTPKMKGFRYLIAHKRAPMGANELLDFDIAANEWTGLLETWRQHAQRVGYPWRHLVMENNAAQKFMSQYDFFRRWKSTHHIHLIPHNTGAHNKSDHEFGVVAMRPNFIHGLVRLPGHPDTRPEHVDPLTYELVRWPDSITDDCVMAEWFFEWQLPRLARGQRERPDLYKADRPSWMTRQSTPQQDFINKVTTG